jgi:hypothetical protein
LGSKHEFHFIHYGLPHARSKRSVGHLRLLKADPHVVAAIQQTGFLRAKRGYGLAKAGISADDLTLAAAKRSPWASIRQALDAGLDGPVVAEEDDAFFDPHVVHDENHYNRLQLSANHRYIYIIIWLNLLADIGRSSINDRRS